MTEQNKTEIKTYHTLPPEAKEIREEVFMKEQGFVNEFDDIDSIATHLVLFWEGQPAGVCRFFPTKEPGVWDFGRLAVRKAYRDKHLGSLLVQEAERQIRDQGGAKLALMAQIRVQKFYEKNGYTPFGEPCDDEGCPHIWMEKLL